MQIERHVITPITIEEFADANGLTMEVHERSPEDMRASGTARFYAHFTRSDIVDGSCLASVFGNGDTEQQAIRAYARRISEKVLVLYALGPTRREIRVPVLKME